MEKWRDKGEVIAPGPHGAHSTQNRSFWRRSSQQISWLSTEETKPNTTKAALQEQNDLS